MDRYNRASIEKLCKVAEYLVSRLGRRHAQVEFCYVQRELEIRAQRAEAHKAWMGGR